VRAERGSFFKAILIPFSEITNGVVLLAAMKSVGVDWNPAHPLTFWGWLAVTLAVIWLWVTFMNRR